MLQLHLIYSATYWVFGMIMMILMFHEVTVIVQSDLQYSYRYTSKTRPINLLKLHRSLINIKNHQGSQFDP